LLNLPAPCSKFEQDMPARRTSTWTALGARIATARERCNFSQAQLAELVSVNRSAISKIESGNRRVGAVELQRFAGALGRPLEWFLESETPPVISRRETPVQAGESNIDVLMDRLARDLDLLLKLGALQTVEPPELSFPVEDFKAAERAAQETRRLLGRSEEPLLDLPRLAEQLGLFSVAESGGADHPDGCYRAVGAAGVAWINGSFPPGRRRFTLAHELGHHVLADAYSLDWGSSDEEPEKLVNAFAIHLLMPRGGVTKRWRILEQHNEDVRSRAIIAAAAYGVSWSAACSQLRRLRLVSAPDEEHLRTCPPREGDYAELEVAYPVELAPPYLSPRFTAATVRAFRTNRISQSRATKLLRGTLSPRELPEPEEVPLDAFARDLDPLG